MKRLISQVEDSTALKGKPGAGSRSQTPSLFRRLSESPFTQERIIPIGKSIQTLYGRVERFSSGFDEQNRFGLFRGYPDTKAPRFP